MKPVLGEHSTKSGVYKIINTTNDNFYIGSTYCFANRCSKHKYKLRRDKHHCLHLQRAWNKYGEDVFEFHVVEVTTTESRTNAEQKYLDLFFGEKYCYNSTPVACAGIHKASKEVLKRIYGRKKTKAEREKISESHKGVRTLKDRGYTKEVEHLLQCIIDGKKLPMKLDNLLVGCKQLREAYNRWPTGSKNLELRVKHKYEKKRLKDWLIGLGLWYDARSDSWNRKSDKDKAAAVKILRANQHKSPIFQQGLK